MTAFKSLLVPVDFTCNTELGVKKAIDMADKQGCTICLLHVLKSEPKPTNGFPEKLIKLRELKLIIEISVPNVSVDLHIIKGKSVEKTIIETALSLKTELIIIARHSGKKWFSFGKKISPARLAKKTLCAVLTLKPGSENSEIKSIVVPFRSHIPKRKLDVLFHLARKKNTTIYLVGMQNELKEFELGDSSVTHTLIETYRLLKEDVNCQIVHKLITGNNIARSMLRFAESVNADVLFANPDEMNISSFSGLDISDMLDSDSKMQLVTVEPEAYHSNNRTLKMMATNCSKQNI
ncbi:MAG TPA: universal stress protein [Puia sp.]|nr:universal stress protein [Puia sp.]